MSRPALSAVTELFKPITWFPPMWAFACGVVASGASMSGRWGLEQRAIAIPKGRQSAMPWLREFAQRARESGQVAAMASRAGLRGLATDRSLS